MDLDRTDKKLLNLVQREFPLTREPYADLGRKLGIEGDEVITRIEQLRVEGIIRQISPVLDARSLGYKTALAAVKVPPLKLDRAERIIREHPGVSHGYERDHSFNLWFTLATPPGVDIEAELRQLISRFEPESALALPAIKIFKIGVFFDVCGDDQVSIGTMARPVGVDLEEVALSPTERLIIKELQQDLPLLPAPFATMAAHLHMDLNHFLAQCQSLLRRGIVRRFGASLNHTKAGF
jgi:DNA-binding Lrp family transcriptional regulator